MLRVQASYYKSSEPRVFFPEISVRLSHALHWRATTYEMFPVAYMEGSGSRVSSAGLTSLHLRPHCHLLSSHYCPRSIGLLVKDQIISWLETKYKYCHIINLNCPLTSLLTCNLPPSTASFTSLKRLFLQCHSSCSF